MDGERVGQTFMRVSTDRQYTTDSLRLQAGAGVVAAVAMASARSNHYRICWTFCHDSGYLESILGLKNIITHSLINWVHPEFDTNTRRERIYCEGTCGTSANSGIICRVARMFTIGRHLEIIQVDTLQLHSLLL